MAYNLHNVVAAFLTMTLLQGPLSTPGTSGAEGATTGIHAADRKKLPPDPRRLLRDYDSARQVQTLIQIGRERNMYSDAARKQLDAVRRLIRKRFNQAGLAVRTQTFQVQGHSGENIIGELRSKKPGARTLVVGAHYDTVNESPGVDDNGTGISALLEVAAVLSRYELDCNVDFVAFDLEEQIKDVPQSGIAGSAAFVTMAPVPPADLLGCINLDMIGYSTNVSNSQAFPPELKGVYPELYDRVEKDEFRGNFLLVISNEASAPLSRTLAAMNTRFVPQLRVIDVPVPGKGEDLPDFRRSDHANFWDHGFQAISLGDGAFSRNPHYHTSQDDFTDINLGFLASVTRLLLLTIAQEGTPAAQAGSIWKK